jgi:SAM-dependent methyltransferase
VTLTFGTYARYYDLLYRDKDYSADAAFVRSLIERHAPAARRVLELGSGTGLHASLLASAGFSVHGVDTSDEQLERAQARRRTLPESDARRVTFSKGDVRSVRIAEPFDVAMSLFHVMSYQTSNEDIRAAFTTARTHLRPGGLFLFDCWFGPAVLTDRPSIRVKDVHDGPLSVVRIARPSMSAADNVCEVHYRMFVRDRAAGAVEEIEETHRMRYFFETEIRLLFDQLGFDFVAAGEWLTDRAPGFDTWSVYFCGRA